MSPVSSPKRNSPPFPDRHAGARSLPTLPTLLPAMPSSAAELPQGFPVDSRTGAPPSATLGPRSMNWGKRKAGGLQSPPEPSSWTQDMGLPPEIPAADLRAPSFDGTPTKRRARKAQHGEFMMDVGELPPSDWPGNRAAPTFVSDMPTQGKAPDTDPEGWALQATLENIAGLRQLPDPHAQRQAFHTSSVQLSAAIRQSPVDPLGQELRFNATRGLAQHLDLLPPAEKIAAGMFLDETVMRLPSLPAIEHSFLYDHAQSWARNMMPHQAVMQAPRGATHSESADERHAWMLSQLPDPKELAYGMFDPEGPVSEVQRWLTHMESVRPFLSQGTPSSQDAFDKAVFQMASALHGWADVQGHQTSAELENALSRLDQLMWTSRPAATGPDDAFVHTYALLRTDLLLKLRPLNRPSFVLGAALPTRDDLAAVAMVAGMPPPQSAFTTAGAEIRLSLMTTPRHQRLRQLGQQALVQLAAQVSNWPEGPRWAADQTLDQLVEDLIMQPENKTLLRNKLSHPPKLIQPKAVREPFAGPAAGDAPPAWLDPSLGAEASPTAKAPRYPVLMARPTSKLPLQSAGAGPQAITGEAASSAAGTSADDVLKSVRKRAKQIAKELGGASGPSRPRTQIQEEIGELRNQIYALEEAPATRKSEVLETLFELTGQAAMPGG